MHADNRRLTSAEKIRLHHEAATEATISAAIRANSLSLKVKLVTPNTDILAELQNDGTERLAPDIWSPKSSLTSDIPYA